MDLIVCKSYLCEIDMQVPRLGGNKKHYSINHVNYVIIVSSNLKHVKSLRKILTRVNQLDLLFCNDLFLKHRNAIFYLTYATLSMDVFLKLQ